MSFQLIFTEAYTLKAFRFLKRHPELKRGTGVNVLYAKTLALLEANPHHPSLRLHALSGKHAGVHSVSINLSYRITLELLITDKQITPINVGDHEAVY
jgi:mRNA-degrading endonuclease YafQ of YafQ-DinJ toxin-antitoxin module